VIRRTFRFGLLLGLLGGVAFAVAKVLGKQSAQPLALPSGSSDPWPRLTSDPSAGAAPIARPVPDPAAPAGAAAPRVWVEPTGGACPTSHPVKAKLTSKIFHLPGMLNYDRTNPDRCYLDATQAEADGLRAAKR